MTASRQPAASSAVELGRALPALDRFEALAVAGMAFVLPAFNGRPARLSDGYCCWAAVILIWLYRLIGRRGPSRIPPSAVPLAAAWFCWTAASTAAAMVNPDGETLTNWAFSYLLPLLMLVTLLGRRMTDEQADLVIAALCIGVIGRFGFGMLVFYRTWGAPNLASLVLAHFDVLRILPYQLATFGNTSNTAALVAPLGVLLCLALVSVRLSLLSVVLVGVALFTLAANGLITGSRAFVFVSAAGLGLAGLKLKLRWAAPLLGGFFVAYAFLSSNLGAGNLARFGAVASSNIGGDRSLTERVLSIRSGLQTMAEHPLGVGPGLSYQYNAYTAAHQFAVNQGAELGLVGFFASIALAALVAAKALRSRYVPGGAPHFAFRFASFTWFLFAMTANTPTGTGPEVPWVGLLALFVAAGEMTGPASAPARAPRALAAAGLAVVKP